MTTPSFAEVEKLYRSALTSDMGVDIAALGRTETVVFAEDDRASSNMAVAYHVGKPTLIRADPALAAGLECLVSSVHAPSSAELREWTSANGWEFIDGGDQHVISADLLKHAPLPKDARLISLDRDDQANRSLMAELFDQSDPDDVDAAELELDDLDPHIVGLVDAADQLRALASGREWGFDARFDDIGVLTHPECRRGGWGAAVVTAFCAASFDRGRLPLYRCNWDRVASKALAIKLGFQLVGHLSAIRPLSAV